MVTHWIHICYVYWNPTFLEFISTSAIKVWSFSLYKKYRCSVSEFSSSIFLNKMNHSTQIWSLDIGNDAAWEICFTVNICYQICHWDLMPVTVFGAEGGSSEEKNWEDRKKGAESLERQWRVGAGSKDSHLQLILRCVFVHQWHHKLQCVCVCWQAVCAHPSMCQAWLATQRCAPA